MNCDCYVCQQVFVVHRSKVLLVEYPIIFLFCSQSMYDDEEIFNESDLDATEEEGEGESVEGDNNGWELLPEGEEPVEDRSQGPEPVHIDNPRVVYLVARGGAAGIFA